MNNDEIKIYASVDECGDLHCPHEFIIREWVPKVGDELGSFKVTTVTKMHKDSEQDSSDADFFDCYKVDTVLKIDGTKHGIYVATKHFDRCDQKLTLWIATGICDMNDLNRLIRLVLNKQKQNAYHEFVKSSLDDDDANILQTYYGVQDLNEFTSRMIDGFFGYPTNELTIRHPGDDSTDPWEVTFDFEMDGIHVWEDMPEWYDEPPVIIDEEEHPEFSRSPVTFETVPELAFRRLWASATESLNPDWVAEEGYPVWFNLFGRDVDEIMSNFSLLNDVLYAPFDEFLAEHRQTIKSLSDKLFVPYRTVQDWKRDVSKCNPYLRLLIAEKLGIIKRQ